MTRRSMTLIATAAAAVIPAGGVWAATHPAPRPTATPTARQKTATAVAHKTATAVAGKAATATARKAAIMPLRTYAGPSADMEWGPVQVTIVVKGKRITDVKATAPTERERSAFINQQAIPMLRSEVLRAQSATIDLIGGATLTSEAYAQSLQAAVDNAHKAHSL
jgi:uncharacterized protein with FMN-binding domain